MKHLITAFALFFVFATVGLAQSGRGLIFKKYGTEKSIFVKQDTRVKIITNGEKIKGKFKVVSGQAILIGEDTIQITQIQKLSAKTSSTAIGGTALLVPSGLLAGSGTVLTIAGLASLGDYGIIGVILGVPAAALGIFGVTKAVKLLSNGKIFYPSKWEYSISQPLPESVVVQP